MYIYYVRVILYTLLYFSAISLFASDASYASERHDSLKRITLSARAAVILNRSFSHHIHEIEHRSFSYNARSKPLNKSMLPGFEIGLTSVLNTKSNLAYFIETSYSFTQSEYEFSLSQRLDDTPPLFASSYEKYLCRVQANIWTLGGGVRWKLFKQFLLAFQLGASLGLDVSVNEKGIKEYSEWTICYNASGDPVTGGTFSQVTIDRRYTKRRNAASMRVSLGYNPKKFNGGVILFRNFGIKWQLPWWGIGLYRNF